MSFNYDNPGASAKDEVRFLLGDVYASDAYMSDEEILYCIAQKPNVKEAAIMAGEAVVTRLTHSTDYNIGSEGARDSQKFYNFRAALDSIKREYRKSHECPVMSDSGRDQAFWIGMHDSKG